MKRGEKGFTLLEALIVIAITGAIVGPLAMATTTMLTHPQRSTDQNVVLSQVQNTGYWVSRDVQMARTITPSGTNGFTPTLSLKVPVDTDQNHDNRIDYSFNGTKLTRKVYNASLVLISETFIADYIDTGTSKFSSLGSSLYKLTVKATQDKAVLTRTYEIKQRLSSS